MPLKLKAEALLNVALGRRKYYDLAWNPDSFTRDAGLAEFLAEDALEVRRVTGQFYFAYTPVAERARRGARFLKLPVLIQLPGEDLMIDSDYTRSVDPDGNLKRGDDWEAVGVTCREGASIGARAVCVAPVTIGRWALVAAGSVAAYRAKKWPRQKAEPLVLQGVRARIRVPMRRGGQLLPGPERDA